MEPLSSYKIRNITPEQVRDYVELTESSGIEITSEITDIILKMLSNGIQPEAIYHICVDLRNEKKAARLKKKKTNVEIEKIPQPLNPLLVNTFSETRKYNNE